MDNSWIAQRNCAIHMTLRDVDCVDFDADRMAKDFHDFGVDCFSFFAGGYITTYPSKIPESTISPFLGDQDITRDIIASAHRYGIKAIAMADFSVLTPALVASHPAWAMIDRQGNPYEYNANAKVYAACILGGYATEYGSRMVQEILANYDVDAIKFGGGSYGFDQRICYCDKCRDSFLAHSQKDLPAEINWDDPVFKIYHEWKALVVNNHVRRLRDMVVSINPEMPVMGNAFALGALDMEEIGRCQSMLQLESQGRVTVDTSVSGFLKPVTFTAEAAMYMTNVTETPVWLVVSYFTHAPWRRSAFSYAEQKVYLAQIAAHGASPMVNLSGGPPAVHEDQRGFRAPTEIWHFIRDHREYFSFDRSGANVAMVYSDRSVAYYGKSNPLENYLSGFRGTERALMENHIPFDIISSYSLLDGKLSRYKTIILSNYACMRENEAEAIRSYVRQGGHVIANFETSLYDEYGNRREEFLLADVLGIHLDGDVKNVFGDHPANMQNYCRITESSPLLCGIEGTSLIPVAGRYCEIEAADDVGVPLRLAHPFIVLPEGLSYTLEADIGTPMAVTGQHEGMGRTVYFNGQFDKMHLLMGLEETSMLISNAVMWTVDAQLPATCDAPESVLMSVRTQPGRVMIHLINLTGGQRFFKKILPVEEITVRVSTGLIANVQKVYDLSSGLSLDFWKSGDDYCVKLQRLEDYSVLVFE